MKSIRKLIAAIVLAGLPVPACTQANERLNDAEKIRAELASIRQDAEKLAQQAERIQAEARQRCDRALVVLEQVEATAPFACGLIEQTPDGEASKVPKALCAQRDKLPDAVSDVVRACNLIGGV